MTYRLAKISSKRFFKNLKKGHEVRPIYESNKGDESNLSPELLAALDEFVYAWNHSEEYPHFTNADDVMRYLENDKIDRNFK